MKFKVGDKVRITIDGEDYIGYINSYGKTYKLYEVYYSNFKVILRREDQLELIEEEPECDHRYGRNMNGEVKCVECGYVPAPFEHWEEDAMDEELKTGDKVMCWDDENCKVERIYIGKCHAGYVVVNNTEDESFIYDNCESIKEEVTKEEALEALHLIAMPCYQGLKETIKAYIESK